MPRFLSTTLKKLSRAIGTELPTCGDKQYFDKTLWNQSHDAAQYILHGPGLDFPKHHCDKATCWRKIVWGGGRGMAFLPPTITTGRPPSSFRPLPPSIRHCCAFLELISGDVLTWSHVCLWVTCWCHGDALMISGFARAGNVTAAHHR